MDKAVALFALFHDPLSNLITSLIVYTEAGRGQPVWVEDFHGSLLLLLLQLTILSLWLLRRHFGIPLKSAAL